MRPSIQVVPTTGRKSRPRDSRSISKARQAGLAPIYERLAPFYDRLVGDALFPVIRDSFEWCRKRLGLRFRSAADIGCGTGRFLVHMLRYRVPLIGVDGSAAALRIAARRLPGRAVDWMQQDIRGLHLPRPVDLITCNGDTLNYLLRRQDLANTLQRCSNHLKPGGYLIGDFLSGLPSVAVNSNHQHSIQLPGLISKWHWLALPNQRITRVSIRFSFNQGDSWRHDQEVHWQRWHPWYEVRELLIEAGLTGCQVWKMPSNGGAGPSGRWLKFAARRAG